MWKFILIGCVLLVLTFLFICIARQNPVEKQLEDQEQMVFLKTYREKGN